MAEAVDRILTLALADGLIARVPTAAAERVDVAREVVALAESCWTDGIKGGEISTVLRAAAAAGIEPTPAERQRADERLKVPA